MPLSVRSCFNKFQEDHVDLEAAETKQARTSRNYLQVQLQNLENTYRGFPELTGKFTGFGSFARKTKILPLDDIDILVILNSSGTVENHQSSDLCWLRISDNNTPLRRFSDAYNYVNSTKILNIIRDGLDTVSIYGKSDIKKTMQAVTLNLQSYSWVFDVVPAVEVVDWNGNIEHYLIPDGRGSWTRTDPRRDSTFVTAVNQRHSGSFLPVMRLLKYWNNRRHKPRLPSYYFETLVLNVFQYAPKITDYPNAIKYFFSSCPTYLWSSCPDPKGLGPNLDTNISWDTKQKVAQAMNSSSIDAQNAVYNESQGNQSNAIAWWKRVFGQDFPDYGY